MHPANPATPANPASPDQRGFRCRSGAWPSAELAIWTTLV
ncbi:hypothetical protein HX92_3800 [Mycobacterium tuberculosis]|nr:predicted protein [Mycobacterium tuberculosis T46]KQL73940.1 hypothetical protein HX92_3800 [Mycobacterium tuberculosis]CDM08307.1 hypothetical protein MT49_0139 [Mycobacterium tuberculosis 49-02]